MIRVLVPRWGLPSVLRHFLAENTLSFLKNDFRHTQTLLKVTTFDNNIEPSPYLSMIVIEHDNLFDTFH